MPPVIAYVVVNAAVIGYVGLALQVVGAVTKEEKLMKLGQGLSVVGGLGAIGGAMGAGAVSGAAADAAAADVAQDAALQTVTDSGLAGQATLDTAMSAGPLTPAAYQTAAGTAETTLAVEAAQAAGQTAAEANAASQATQATAAEYGITAPTAATTPAVTKPSIVKTPEFMGLTAAVLGGVGSAVEARTRKKELDYQREQDTYRREQDAKRERFAASTGGSVRAFGSGRPGLLQGV